MWLHYALPGQGATKDMASLLYEVEWSMGRQKIDSAIRRNFIITLLQLVENDEFIRIV